MLPDDIQSLVTVCKDQSNNAGLFSALLNLLERTSDSSIIVEALNQLPIKDLKVHANLAERARKLLVNADALKAASFWNKEKTDKVDTQDKPTVIDNLIDTLNKGDEIHDLDTEGSSIPKSTLNDVAGLYEVKKQIHRKIIRPFEKPSLYEKFKLRSGGGLLMYGAPGCGKTMLAKAVAGECKATFFEVRSSDILDKYWGVAEKRIVETFENARTNTPCVLFFDEIEILAQRRNSDHAYLGSLVSTLLREMDGLESRNDGILFLGATNLPWSIDPAFQRPGRFDRTIFIPPPDKIARKYLLKLLLEERPTAHDINLDKFVSQTSGYSGADLVALIETAADFAIEESYSADDIQSISNAHIQEAVTEIRPSTGEWFGLAKSFVEYSNIVGQYDDLKMFLKKYT